MNGTRDEGHGHVDGIPSGRVERKKKTVIGRNIPKKADSRQEDVSLLGDGRAGNQNENFAEDRYGRLRPSTQLCNTFERVKLMSSQAVWSEPMKTHLSVARRSRTVQCSILFEGQTWRKCFRKILRINTLIRENNRTLNNTNSIPNRACRFVQSISSTFRFRRYVFFLEKFEIALSVLVYYYCTCTRGVARNFFSFVYAESR